MIIHFEVVVELDAEHESDAVWGLLEHNGIEVRNNGFGEAVSSFYATTTAHLEVVKKAFSNEVEALIGCEADTLKAYYEVVTEVDLDNELERFAMEHNWKIEAYHGEYKGILCGYKYGDCNEMIPMYKFPGCVSLA